jgi:hypothetical protein
MWLYPIPALLAIGGFLHILVMRKNFLREVVFAAVILITGLALYLLRARHNREWPFQEPVPSPAEVRAS